MPPRTLKPCCAPHCPNLSKGRYCDDHKHLGWENHQAGRTRTQRGYGPEWDKLRRRIMRRDKQICQPCKRQGIATLATDVDHIINKARGGDDADSNLEAICTCCHKAKTARERMK